MKRCHVDVHSLAQPGRECDPWCEELMLKEAAWTAKFIRRQREEEAEAGTSFEILTRSLGSS